MAYIYEKAAREYSALAPQIQIDRTAALFEQVHPGVRAEFERAATWSWANEPFSRGAFTITKVGGFPPLARAAAREGRVHFAGEHTSPWPCWIQGALHSGLRAASEVEQTA